VLVEHDGARVDEAELRAMIAGVDVATMLEHANPADKAALEATSG